MLWTILRMRIWDSLATIYPLRFFYVFSEIAKFSNGSCGLRHVRPSSATEVCDRHQLRGGHASVSCPEKRSTIKGTCL